LAGSQLGTGAVDGNGVGVEDTMLLEALLVTEDRAAVLDGRLDDEIVLEMALDEGSLEEVATDDKATEEDELVAEDELNTEELKSEMELAAEEVVDEETN
jgi:hypothetical protein